MILDNEPIETYHARPTLSKSKLTTFDLYGPVHYHATYVARTMVREDTPSLWFGRRFDGLTEDAAKERATWAPPVPEDAPSKPTKKQINAKKPSPETLDAIAWWNRWNAEHGNKVEVSADDQGTLNEMLAALETNTIAKELWASCRRQVTIRRELGALGVELQARPDGLALNGKEGKLVDIKTTRDINRFALDSITYGYHMQLAIGQVLLAREGYQVEPYLIAVESKRAPRCKVFRMPEIALSAGWQKAKSLIDEIARRTNENDWTEVQTEIEEITLPDWQTRKLEAIG